MAAVWGESVGHQDWFDPVIAAYDRGLLVPFIGAGMSFPACPLWADFVTNLEGRAGVARPDGSLDLVHRAARAVRKLRLGSARQDLAAAVASALADGPRGVPPQTNALARIFWPLVVTTNYDDLYVAAAHEAHMKDYRSSRARLSREDERVRSLEPLLLLGRSPDDCWRVLISLRQPDVPILWALQGFIGGQAEALPSQPRQPEHSSGTRYRERLDDPEYRQRCKALEKELVVGHAEYRRVAMASEPFRRAFAELYRSRSLLFLGSGLRDKYFLDLFSEIIELYGASPQPHFALLVKGESDPDFLRQYFGIWVSEIETYDGLPELLDKFASRIAAPRTRQLTWHFGKVPLSEPVDRAGLRIVRGEIPTEPPEGGCLVFSAGGSAGKLSLSRIGEQILHARRLSFDEQAFERIDAEGAVPLWRHKKDARFLAVNARLDPWSEAGARLRPTDPTKKPIGQTKAPTAGGRARRDIRIVPPAVQELMQAAHEAGYRQVHSMLLVGGPLRTFPQSQGLLQMARGWARWSSQARGQTPGLSIYLTARDVLHDLDAGRLDIRRNLVPDVVEFWLEIVTEGGGVDRYLHVAHTSSPLRAVLRQFDIEDPAWRLKLTPEPCRGWANWTLNGVAAWEHRFAAELSLETFGVLPESTVRLVEAASSTRSGSTP